MDAPAPAPRVHWGSAVSAAREAGRPIVALESSVLAQGLRPPANREAAVRMAGAVTSAGAAPAVTAVVRGRLTAGLEGDDLERFLAGKARKVSARDIGWAVASGADGATTVAGALAIAAVAGIPVFATGGIGGVHRAAPYDESADLAELARSAAIVVCAGAKSILDLPATVERLETHGVAVVGWKTDEFPGFFTRRTGLPVSAVARSADDVARAYLADRALGRTAATLVVQPPPSETALDPAVVERAVEEALAGAAGAGVRGAAVTPYLLGAVERATGGRSVTANLALLEANARLAAEIAVALAAIGPR